MATYRQIHNEMWDDPDFQELSLEGKIVFIYLFSNHKVGESGLYIITPRRIAFDTSVSIDTVAELLDGGIKNVLYDTDNNIVFIRKHRIYNQMGGSPEKIKLAISNERLKYPSRLWGDFDKLYNEYGNPLLTLNNGLGDGFENPSLVSIVKFSSVELKEKVLEIFNYWISFDELPKHRKLTIAAKKAINARLKDGYTTQEIKAAIKGYATSRDKFWVEQRGKKIWGLDTFLSRGEGKNIERFIPKAKPATEPEPEPIPWAVPLPQAKPTSDDRKKWRAVLKTIRERIGVQEFNTWLRALNIDGLSNGAVWISVPNEVYKDFIETNYVETIKEVMTEIFEAEVTEVYIATCREDDLFEYQ